MHLVRRYSKRFVPYSNGIPILLRRNRQQAHDSFWMAHHVTMFGARLCVQVLSLDPTIAGRSPKRVLTYTHLFSEHCMDDDVFRNRTYNP